ncbi:hypothetical protein DW048_22795 [Phocaeicola vulgatus]|nr:hypothetical protein DW048_22795 [Phocaeicola vulgatus]
MVYSLIASCKSAEVDPRIWLEDVLSKIPYNERVCLNSTMTARTAKDCSV